jgi:outer membrane cobalamin receptor
MKGQLNLTDGLTFQGALSHIKSKDISTGDPLRYSPKWIGNCSTQIQSWNWVLDLSLHMTGKQIIMYDYPKDLTMDLILTSHLSITSPNIFRDQLNFMIHVSNLFNQEIMTIYGYPEPSRVIRLNISYRINTKNTK